MTEKNSELSEKNKIIDLLQLQIIHLNNQNQNLKTLIKKNTVVGSSPKQVSSPAAPHLHRMNTGVIRQSCTNIYSSGMNFNRSGTITVRKTTIDQVEEEPISLSLNIEPVKEIDAFDQILDKSIERT